MEMTQALRDKNDAYWLYWVYQAACMPGMVTWARKKNKGKLLKSIDELLGTMDKKNRKSLRKVNPTAFRNAIELLNAAEEGDREFIEKFLQLTPESKVAKRQKSFREFYIECNKNSDPDEIAKLGLIFSAVNKGLEGVEEKDKGLLQTLARQVIAEFAMDKSNPQIWDIETDVPRWEVLAKSLAEGFVAENFEEKTSDLEMEWTQEFVQELFSWNEIYGNDFWKTPCGRKDLEKLARLLMIQLQNQYGLLDELVCINDVFSDEVFDRENVEKLHGKVAEMAERFEREFYAAIMFYRMSLMYKNARDEANKAIEENIELKNEIRELKGKKVLEEEKARRKLGKEKDAALAEDKQKQLNRLQIEHEKLQEKLKELQAENKFLGEMLKSYEEKETEAAAAGLENFVEEAAPVSYPKGTVLFGGHPNWQRKFAEAYPNVKIMSGSDEHFPENTVSPKTPLVLLNSYHMSHKTFYKIRRLQQRMKFKIEYVK